VRTSEIITFNVESLSPDLNFGVDETKAKSEEDGDLLTLMDELEKK